MVYAIFKIMSATNKIPWLPFGSLIQLQVAMAFLSNQKVCSSVVCKEQNGEIADKDKDSALFKIVTWSWLNFAKDYFGFQTTHFCLPS